MITSQQKGEAFIVALCMVNITLFTGTDLKARIEKNSTLASSALTTLEKLPAITRMLAWEAIDILNNGFVDNLTVNGVLAELSRWFRTEDLVLNDSRAMHVAIEICGAIPGADPDRQCFSAGELAQREADLLELDDDARPAVRNAFDIIDFYLASDSPDKKDYYKNIIDLRLARQIPVFRVH